MSPLVSILLPTYNQQSFVAETIQSCLNQSWPAIEILIGDDASTDNTWDVIAPLAAANPDRIKAFRNPRNLGVSANCNQLLARMSGKYVALFAGDDLMYPEKLRRQVELMEQHSDVALCAHDMDIITDASSSPIGKWSDTTASHSGGVELLFQHLCFMCGCSLLVRRECIPAEGYVESLVASDWLLFVQVLLHADQKIHSMPDVLGAYRRRTGQLTSKSPQSFSNLLDHAFACGYLHARYPDRAKDIAMSLKNWKAVLASELRDHAVWESGISQSQLTSPRWLLKRLVTSIKRRIKG